MTQQRPLPRHSAHWLVSGLLCSTALLACDPGDDLDASGHERAALTPEALAIATEEAIVESLEYTPDPARFEYTGHISDADGAWRRGPRTTAPRRLTTDGEELADLVDIMTRDGRTYRQRVGTAVAYASHRSSIDGMPTPTAIGHDEDREGITSLTFRDLITDGIDNRIRVTTAAAQAVMVKLGDSATDTVHKCSASMIAPRVFITAAHCVTDGNGDWDYSKSNWVIPSSRGNSFSGDNATLDANDTPWGGRQVIRFIKPTAWAGNGATYDYAVLVIGDHAPDNSGSIQWDPQPALFANESCNDLEGAWTNFRGYPGVGRNCADASPEDNGKCGGFAYTENRPIDECTSEKLFRYHDSQGGQSGGPVYLYDGTTGVRTIVGVHHGSGSRTIAHKIRAASYNVMCAQVEDPDNLSSYFTNPSC